MISSLRVEINDSEVYHTEPETKELSGGKAPLHHVGEQHYLYVCVWVWVRLRCQMMEESSRARGMRGTI